MKQPDILYVDNVKICCQGDEKSATGHPRIYLNIENTGKIDCPYCGKQFVLKDGVA